MQQTECAAIGACLNAPWERQRDEGDERARTHARTHASPAKDLGQWPPGSSSRRSLHARLLSPLFLLYLVALQFQSKGASSVIVSVVH
jgi:hypothetical protein